MRILYIEDTAYWRELYEKAFSEADIEVKTLPDARGDIVKEAADYRPDLILLDIMMPEVDGFEAFTVLRSDEKTKNIPIFFFSNMSSPATIKKGLDLGAENYIVKGSVEPEEVIKIITDYGQSKPK